ncbi:CDP-glycerol glycerophosphotransferase [Methanobrevibacter gottschalkii]|uniref:CDP-glycerol glycerophosphotransferase n=1 Tax=Methanobrevibacter gottschalkii TaxID=190974 RepID=A0A1H7NEL1_9EURY|nr:CDP-glycerol glycerophosphotransferase family protein [Methanobrevibacter gottschalkii]SEL22016.1 CDP-glycerol glycerophosphotransferase [Methanobrevibacter gottschalkii]
MNFNRIITKSKTNFKKLLKKSSKLYSYPYVKLSADEENIIIEVEKDKISPNLAIEIKHRQTGYRIEKKINSNQVLFSINELLEIDTKGVFDLYIKILGKFSRKKRVIFNSKNQIFKAVSKEKNIILRSYATKFNNLSLKIQKSDFDYKITTLECYGEDKVLIEGNLEILNDEITHIDKISITGKNRLDSQSNNFDLDFKQSAENKSKYIFRGYIDEISASDEKILNLRMDFFIRIYEDGIFYQSLIYLSDFKNFKNDEDRFLIKIDKCENVYSFYATEKSYTFALWITTEISWLRSYNIACGRTIYNNYCEQPLQDIIFFESFFGKSYGGNPKYIYEKMLELGLDNKFTFVWAYSGDNTGIIPGNPIIVNRFEPGDYYKYLALSKYWVNNIIFPIHKKRTGNIYLQTWHGTPLKKLGYDITIPGPEIEGRQNFYNESRNWDYLISSNEYSSEIFKRAFKYKKKMLELGYPINDIFFKDNDELINSIKSKFGINKNKKIILYAPTWKDDEQNDSWEHYFKLNIDLNRLYEEFGDEYIFLLKMHHLVSENLVIEDKLKDFVIDLSSYEDIQELYVLSDILITDYSSVFFDYAHTKRPILFFVPDLNHYISNVRGSYLNMEKDLPGPLIKNNDELIDAIKNINQITYIFSKQYEEFYEKFCSICDGNSAEKIINNVFI